MTLFFNDPATTEIYTLSLHDALPISRMASRDMCSTAGAESIPSAGRLPQRDIPIGKAGTSRAGSCSGTARPRSEEHTSELQSRSELVCRPLLENKNTVFYVFSSSSMQ